RERPEIATLISRAITRYWRFPTVCATFTPQRVHALGAHGRQARELSRPGKGLRNQERWASWWSIQKKPWSSTVFTRVNRLISVWPKQQKVETSMYFKGKSILPIRFPFAIKAEA